jgi:hypothetical protein
VLSNNKFWNWNNRSHVVVWGVNRTYVIDGDSGEIEEELEREAEEVEENPDRLICLD